MTLKEITIEFNKSWHRDPIVFNGWVYYMVSGLNYKIYRIEPNQKSHVLLGNYAMSEIKDIKEKIL